MKVNLSAKDYQKAFKKADKNHDGQVTQKEARKAWRAENKKLDKAKPNGVYSQKDAKNLGALVGLSALAHNGQTGKSLDSKELAQNQAYLDQNIGVDFRRRDPSLSIGNGDGSNEHNISSIDVTTAPYQNDTGAEGRGYELSAGFYEKYGIDQQGIYFNLLG